MLPEAISPEAVVIESVPMRTLPTRSTRLSFICFSACNNLPVSLVEFASIRLVRSPEATASATAMALSSGTTIARITIKPKPIANNTPKPTATTTIIKIELKLSCASANSCAATLPCNSIKLNMVSCTALNFSTASFSIL